MTARYRLVKVGSRGGMFYCEDTETEKRTSLRTKDEEEATRLVNAKNESLKTTLVNRQIGMAYLSSADPTLVERNWEDVMKDVIKDKTGPTLKRWNTAIKDEAFDLIRKKVVVLTVADEFMSVLRAGT